ncbi:MAG: MFS transporter [Anaerolineae bacterium]|nr:MFS transporter [Anaerolineae bacterium]
MKPRYRWYVAAVMFLFLLLHQADKLLIGPLTTAIMEDFQINEAQMGAVSSLAIVVASVLYPLWGYLYDRYARAKLLALASFIWGSTTWLNALARTFTGFMITRSSTGIDDSSYPGLYSLLSDYFEPRLRGKVYGLMQMSGPLGFMVGTILATQLGAVMGWRQVFFLTGGLGIVVAVIIFFTVREVPRGSSEPEFQGLESTERYRIDWETVRGLLRNRTLLLLMAQGFFGVFPWNVLTFWFFRYLETERGYTPGQAMTTMLVAIVALAAGYFVGGSLGDALFKRSPRGRVLVGGSGVLLGAGFLLITMNINAANTTLFMVLMAFTGITMSIAAPNVMATVHDTTVPEVRSTARSMHKLVEDGGAAMAPWLAGVIAMRASLHTAILGICVSTWIICAILFGVTALVVPGDVERLRHTMQERAREVRQHAA